MPIAQYPLATQPFPHPSGVPYSSNVAASMPPLLEGLIIIGNDSPSESSYTSSSGQSAWTANNLNVPVPPQGGYVYVVISCPANSTTTVGYVDELMGYYF